MALEQRLTVRLGQRLVMTPSLQQAIKLLQMSKLELVEEVQQELLENPTLEEGQADNAEADAERSEPESAAAEETAPEEPVEQDPFDNIDYDAFFENIESDYTPRAPLEIREDLPDFGSTLAEPTNLADHLTWQLDMGAPSEQVKEIGRAIIGNLDEDGYLRASLDEISQLGDYTAEEVEQTLRMVQAFDPVGVASRDLVECLCLQLEHIGEAGTAAETIVRSHMDKLQTKRYKELAEALEMSLDALREEIEIIQGLDPRPGQKYNTERSTYVVPDVYVVRVDDEYQIQLNEDGLPRLRVNSLYRRMARAGAKGTSTEAEAREYVRNKLRAAMRLIKSLEERQRTIYKVANSIVKFQREFLDYGIERMRPLVLRDVADDIGMHESTVSRVVNNKYMHTHRGLFEMRFFFHSGISSTRGGGSVSSLTVKQKIRRIIEAEDERKPLSDSAIVKRLVGEGLQIARRTVAKYREELKIPSSSARKQAFR